MLFSRRQKCLR